MQIYWTRHQWSGPEAKVGMRLNDRCLNGCCGGPVEVSGEGKRGKQRDEGLGKENGGWERLNKQLARSKLQAVHDCMTAAREGRSCCVWARLCQAVTWAPFTRVRTNLCTDKNLHGSTLRLLGTGGTGRIRPFDRHCSIFRTDSCRHLNHATFCSDCAVMAGDQCRDRSKRV